MLRTFALSPLGPMWVVQLDLTLSHSSSEASVGELYKLRSTLNMTLSLLFNLARRVFKFFGLRTELTDELFRSVGRLGFCQTMGAPSRSRNHSELSFQPNLAFIIGLLKFLSSPTAHGGPPSTIRRKALQLNFWAFWTT